VLKALPRLQKLDNVEVTPEEVSDAVRNPIPQQTKREEVYEEQYNEPSYQQPQQPPPQQQQQQYRAPSPIREVSIFIYRITRRLFTVCFIGYHYRSFYHLDWGSFLNGRSPTNQNLIN
jgi:hypothetical protein